MDQLEFKFNCIQKAIEENIEGAEVKLKPEYLQKKEEVSDKLYVVAIPKISDTKDVRVMYKRRVDSTIRPDGFIYSEELNALINFSISISKIRGELYKCEDKA